MGNARQSTTLAYKSCADIVIVTCEWSENGLKAGQDLEQTVCGMTPRGATVAVFGCADLYNTAAGAWLHDAANTQK